MTTERKPRILLVDDDVELSELLVEYLGGEGYDVSVEHDGARGAERAVAEPYELVVLDVMLPSVNGFEALRRVRQASAIPVVMLTARGEEVDRIVGLESGADDYLAKPFNPRELAARVRAILRRTSSSQSPATRDESEQALVVDDVRMNAAARTVHRGGALVDVTTVEYDVLAIFLRQAGRVVSRERLVREALGREFSPFDRSIDTHVSNIRRKLGPRPDGLDRIKSVRGAGYLYARTGAGDRN